MRCSEVENLLPLYAGGDLPVELREAVEEHLGACAACDRLAAGYASALAGLALLREQQMPPEFWRGMTDGIMARVAGGSAPGDKPEPLPAPTPGATASPAGARILRPAFRSAVAVGAIAAVFVLGIALGFVLLDRLSGRPDGGGPGPVAAVNPPTPPGPAHEPSFSPFQRPLPVATASTQSHTLYGLRDLRGAGGDFAASEGGLEIVAPSHDPRDAFSLDQIRTVSDSDVSVGY